MPSTLIPSAMPSFTGLVVTIVVKSVVTSSLSDEEIENITETVHDAFNVSDARPEVEYVTSASLTLDVIEGVTEDAVISAVTSSVSSMLGVHVADVVVTSVDLESGEITYEVSADSYEDASTIQSKIEDFEQETLEDNIRESLPSANVDGSSVQHEIEVDVTVVVDGSETSSAGDAVTTVTDILGVDFSVSTDIAVVTSGPTVSPTFTTMVPSSAPSVTGIVVTLTLTSTGSLNTSEIEALEVAMAEEFGVAIDDVTADVTYTISGSIVLEEVPHDVSESELEAILEGGIADALGVYSGYVTVDVDTSTGEATYTIVSDDSDDASGVLDTMETDKFLSDVNSEISADLSSTSITSVATEEEITMDVVVTIDATESNVDISETSERVASEFESEGFDSDFESNISYVIMSLC